MLLKAIKDANSFLKSREWKRLLEALPKEYAKFHADQSFTIGMLRSNVEAYRQGNDSIRAAFQEYQLWMKPWDVDLSRIPAGLVHIWHGNDDKHVSVANAHRNAKAIPRARLEIFEGKGHWVWLDNLKRPCEILSS